MNITLNEKEFTQEERDLLSYLAMRKQRAFVVQSAIKAILQGDLPIVQSAREQMQKDKNLQGSLQQG